MPDVPLQENDIVFVPFSWMKNVALRVPQSQRRRRPLSSTLNPEDRVDNPHKTTETLSSESLLSHRSQTPETMKVAIIHPWFLFNGGGERVTGVIAGMFPSADVFTLFSDDRFLPEQMNGRKPITSFLNRIPGGKKHYRELLPFYASAAESFDLRGYDLIISSDSSVCKGVLSDQTATHVSYCHTPTRFIWDDYPRFREHRPWPIRAIFSATSHYLRMWDFQAAQRVDAFAANSKYIAGRIRKFYRRESTVIHPPVEVKSGFISDHTDDYYLSFGRLSYAKRVDLLIKACNVLKRRLVIGGVGRESEMLKRISGPTIEFVGRVSDQLLPSLYSKCRAFLFAADEDFGMVPIEAQSFGRPVIAFGKGGSLETVEEIGFSASPTGIFFKEQSVDATVEAILRFESLEHQFDSHAIRARAMRFDTAVFEEKMRNFVQNSLDGRLESHHESGDRSLLVSN